MGNHSLPPTRNHSFSFPAGASFYNDICLPFIFYTFVDGQVLIIKYQPNVYRHKGQYNPS